MKTIFSEIEIAEAQKQFESSFHGLTRVPFETTLGFQPATTTVQVIWIASLGIWAHFGQPPGGKSEGGRFWNAFGIGKPGASENIVCEINPPLSGINKRTAGAFVRDSNLNLWVAHRGKFNVHGGMKMEFFSSHYGHHRYTQVEDGGDPYKMILVGRLGSPEFPEKLAEFIFEVDRIKDLARAANS